MAEGIQENKPYKQPGILKKIVWEIEENIPWTQKGRKKRSISVLKGKELKPFAEHPKEEQKEPVIKITLPASPEKQEEISLFPNLEANIKASEQFIRAFRNPNLYTPNSSDPQSMESKLGFEIKGPVKTGWFEGSSVVWTAERRYGLPMAIYVKGNHARLVVKGPYGKLEGNNVKISNSKIMIYDPMKSGFDEIPFDWSEEKNKNSIVANLSALSKMNKNE